MVHFSHLLGSSRGSTLGLNLRLPMYLGGIDPAYSVSSDAGVASGLVGCISDVSQSVLINYFSLFIDLHFSKIKTTVFPQIIAEK